jgi:hypothetical protein
MYLAARASLAHRGSIPFEYSVGLAVASPAAQIDFNRRMLRWTLPLDAAVQIRAITAYNWAARGAWDSALATIDQPTGNTPDLPRAVDTYRLAVLGAWLGALPNAQAVKRRPPAAVALAITEAVFKAELGWLDGVLAAARQDAQGLRLAAAAMQAAGDTSAVRSRLVDLAPFELALRGKRQAASFRLATLEMKSADRNPWMAFETHPIRRAINRMAAVPWLLAAGDTARAVELLMWHEAYSGPFMEKIPVAPLAYLELARIEEARGHLPAARRDYQQFLARYDMPPASHHYLIQEASVALARLTGAVEVSGGH